jgi:hypothetical protein
MCRHARRSNTASRIAQSLARWPEGQDGTSGPPKAVIGLPDVRSQPVGQILPLLAGESGRLQGAGMQSKPSPSSAHQRLPGTAGPRRTSGLPGKRHKRGSKEQQLLQESCAQASRSRERTQDAGCRNALLSSMESASAGCSERCHQRPGLTM